MTRRLSSQSNVQLCFLDPRQANVGCTLILALRTYNFKGGCTLSGSIGCSANFRPFTLEVKKRKKKKENGAKKKRNARRTALFLFRLLSAGADCGENRGRMISIKTGCCLKASSCQAELPLRHRHHNRGCPSHNSVWLAQGENGSLRRVRPAAAWQVCICGARRTVYLLSFCLLGVSVFSARGEAAGTKWRGEYSLWCEEAKTCLCLVSLSHTHTNIQTDLLWFLYYYQSADYDFYSAECCRYIHNFADTGSHLHVSASAVRLKEFVLFNVFSLTPSRGAGQTVSCI